MTSWPILRDRRPKPTPTEASEGGLKDWGDASADTFTIPDSGGKSVANDRCSEARTHGLSSIRRAVIRQ
jgi:hypothetical protein